MHRRGAFCAVAVLAILLTACAPGTANTAYPVGSVPTVGPLYLGSTPFHGCTASVVSSPGQNLLITAAHCLSGTARGMTFAPGSGNGSEPYGRWTVVAAYVDPGWLRAQDPMRDVAFLKVAPDSIFGDSLQVQQVTGANRLIATPPVIGQIQVPAYCGGYVGGTSGAPFLQGSTVLGVIGGLHQGGCTPSTSYSSPFDATTIATFNRAASGGPGDTLPAPGSDGG